MSIESARLILDDAQSGALNMAVDQALLQTADLTESVTLRLYQWDQPTLSLGYFQKHLDRQGHSPSLSCPLVRRYSGGGAILHHHEVTYSLAIPSKNQWAKKNSELYAIVHRVIIGILKQSGIEARLYGDLPESEKHVVEGHKPFLCFQRRTDGDIVFEEEKICGSAQRRQKNALIQHGSFLLDRSIHAPELPGINDLIESPVVEIQSFQSKFIERLSIDLGLQFGEGNLTDGERKYASELLSTKFESENWNQRK